MVLRYCGTFSASAVELRPGLWLSVVVTILAQSVQYYFIIGVMYPLYFRICEKMTESDNVRIWISTP